MLDLSDFWGPPWPMHAEPATPPSNEQIQDWERQHSMRLPETLAAALVLQNGGCVSRTGLVLWPLRELSRLSEPRWDRDVEFNNKFGDPSGLCCIGQHEDFPGLIVLDYNQESDEPRVLWLWQDLGDELRDEGDGTFDELIRRHRESSLGSS